MAQKRTSTKAGRPAVKKAKVDARPAAAPAVSGSPGGTIPAEIMKKTIAYFYLLSFCPPEKLGAFLRVAESLRGRLAEGAGTGPALFFRRAVPEACRRIVAFHQATCEPDATTVESLAAVLANADQSPECLAEFQKRLAEIASLPARSGVPNRLLQDRGCRRCAAPCRFGFFVLISSPQFGRLQELMAEESSKPSVAQSPLSPAIGFAVSHLLDFTGGTEGFLRIEDLANLSYCLLIWGMARSRIPLPENYLRRFQEANQEFVRRSKIA